MFIKPGPIQEEEKAVTVGFFKLVFFFLFAQIGISPLLVPGLQ